MIDRRNIKAYHEAGHAVIACKLGIAVSYVTILDLDDETGGVVAMHGFHLARDADLATQLAAIAKDVVVCLAGPNGQHRHHPQKNKRPEEWADDIETAGHLSAMAALIESTPDMRAFPSEVATGSRQENVSNQQSRARFRLNRNGNGSGEIDADVPPHLNADQTAFAESFFQRCSDEAHELVDRHWPAIDRVARALLVRPILNGADLEALIRDPASIALR